MVRKLNIYDVSGVVIFSLSLSLPLHLSRLFSLSLSPYLPPSPATEDYTSISRTLAFSNSISVHNISIDTTDDDIFEGNELLQLILFQPQPTNSGVKLTDAIMTNVTIVDNDGELVI